MASALTGVSEIDSPIVLDSAASSATTLSATIASAAIAPTRMGNINIAVKKIGQIRPLLTRCHLISSLCASDAERVAATS